MTISLQSVCETDDPFLFELYASTREAELSQVPWTDTQKQAFLQMQFDAQKRGYKSTHPGAEHQLICADGVPVGRLYLDRLADRLHILDITVAPRFRHSGFGSCVLRGILDEANTKNKMVTIYVESFNPSVRLFQRLGFEVASVDGFQLLLERHPGTTG
ncbi:MAG TPA: GNAT family N-acetyltransferase [Bryobacteraceae bacterium]|nr:GNAT family N-acetyltransferase [Bryobacteraceae bacterium]